MGPLALILGVLMVMESLSAFLHALRSFGSNKWNLFVAVNLIPEDIVAGYVTDGFDRDSFGVECDFVALHYFLNAGTDMRYACIYAGLLF